MREYIPKDALLIPSDAKQVFSGKIFDVYQWNQQLFDGSVDVFEMLRRKDTVKVIAIKDNKAIITRQQQPRMGQFYDFPGGRHDRPDENELVAAQREMLEETGMTFRSWKLVEARQPYKKIDWLVYVFIATDYVSQTSQNLDGGERIEVEEVDFAHLKELAQTEPYLKNSIIAEASSLDEVIQLPPLHEY